MEFYILFCLVVATTACIAEVMRDVVTVRKEISKLEKAAADRYC